MPKPILYVHPFQRFLSCHINSILQFLPAYIENLKINKSTNKLIDVLILT